MDDEIKKILREAIEAEIEGYNLYAGAAKTARKAEVKAIFNRLANDEIKHRKILEAELKLMVDPRAAFVTLERETTPVSELEERLVAAESATMALRETTEELSEYRDRVQRELDMAEIVQRRMLPKGVPKLPGLEVEGRSKMARQVGGDYFDFSLRNDHLSFAIGDVMGKGMPAAILMATLRAAWRAEVVGGFDPPKVLRLMNEALHEDMATANSFVSLISADYDVPTGALSFANAGHMPPFYLPAGADEVHQVISQDILIGIDPSAEYTATRLLLDEGDLLLFYTDGLTDAIRKAGGERQIQEMLVEDRSLGAREIVDILLARVDSLGAEGVVDDATVIVLKKVRKTAA